MRAEDGATMVVGTNECLLMRGRYCRTGECQVLARQQPMTELRLAVLRCSWNDYGCMVW